jgi:transposase-like protein
MTQRHAHDRRYTMARTPNPTAALTRAIACAVRAGRTLGQAATAHGVVPRAAYEWRRRGALEVEGAGELTALGDFCVAVRRARAQFAERLLREVNRLAYADGRATKAMEERARAAMRTLERRFPEHWGSERARTSQGRVTAKTRTKYSYSMNDDGNCSRSPSELARTSRGRVVVTVNVGALRGTGPQMARAEER